MKRANGEGCVYYREDKKLWCASVQVSIDDSGKRVRKVLYGKTQEEVIEKKKKLESTVTTGLYIEPSKITVNEFLNTWMEEIAKPSLRLSTYYRNKGVLDNHINPALGKIQLCKLSAIQIQQFYNRRLSEGQSPRSIHIMHYVLHRALSQAVKWGYLLRNVSDMVELPKVHKKEMQVLTQEQVNQFLSVAKDDWYYPLYVTALTTGLRQGELIGLKWEDINLNDGTLMVKRTLKEVNGQIIIGEPKTKKGFRQVTIPSLTITVLREHKKRQLERGFIVSGWVFTDTQGKYVRVQNMVRRSFKKLLKKAGLKDIRFHDQRHIHSTLLLQQGVNPKLVQERLGHSSITVTLDTYSHVLPNMQKQVAKELDVIFGR